MSGDETTAQMGRRSFICLPDPDGPKIAVTQLTGKSRAIDSRILLPLVVSTLWSLQKPSSPLMVLMISFGRSLRSQILFYEDILVRDSPVNFSIGTLGKIEEPLWHKC
jgi:hypothetical protein